MITDNGELLRVAVSGAHSAGKTTLVNDLHGALNAQGIVTRVAGEPIRALSANPAAVSPDESLARLLTHHFERLTQADCRCCVYDRSLLDFCAYLRVEEIGNSSFRQLATELLTWYAPYIHLQLYLPPEIPLVPDTMRPRSPEYRARVDVELRQLAQLSGMVLVEISGSQTERCASAMECVRNLLH